MIHTDESHPVESDTKGRSVWEAVFGWTFDDIALFIIRITVAGLIIARSWLGRWRWGCRWGWRCRCGWGGFTTTLNCLHLTLGQFSCRHQLSHGRAPELRLVVTSLFGVISFITWQNRFCKDLPPQPHKPFREFLEKFVFDENPARFIGGVRVTSDGKPHGLRLFRQQKRLGLP
jgi:hypothetical protein